MKAVVLYESLFGNTEAIAEAVGDGLRSARPDAAVECRSVDQPGDLPEDLDLVILGAPTHFWSLTGTLSRTLEWQYEHRFRPRPGVWMRGVTREAAAATGMRTQLSSLPPGRGRAAAAFDTCISGPLTGGARGVIARRLEQAGYRLVADPEAFLVSAVAGPLRPGEAERARAWGARLPRALDQALKQQQDTRDRKTTMESQNAVLDGQDARVGRTGGEADRASRPVDITRIVTTAEVVVGAVLVAHYLSRRPGSSKALVTMGPGGWVSMKGGTVAVRRGSRPWARPTPLRPATNTRAPLWARVLSAVPLQALMA